jgi:predicted O-methyltransferase YrrM
MRKSLLSESIENHIHSHLVHQTEFEEGLYAESMKLENAGMCSSPEVGQVLSFFVKLTRSKRILEIGTFTGYTALKMASALPHDGQLVACDVSEEWTNIGRHFWKLAGVDQKIHLHLAPALETLQTLEPGSFDLAFIDADKPNYPHYYEAALGLVRSGGLIILDNMLWDGKVAGENEQDEDTVILRELGIKVAHDIRVTASMLTVGDGLIVATVH